MHVDPPDDPSAEDRDPTGPRQQLDEAGRRAGDTTTRERLPALKRLGDVRTTAVATCRRAWRTGTPAHVLTLLVALPVLLRTNRFQWFFGDEWDFLARRGLRHAEYGLFQPHNEHWSTLPILVYRALYSLFGIRSYAPYVLVLVTVHLLIVHLLWRVMRRCGAHPMVVLALTTIFALLGVGSENLLWAFQIGFIGSVALGLVQILLVSDGGALGARDVIGWLVAVLGLMCSGIGVTMVAIAGLVALFRGGARRAFFTVVVPGGAYVVWLAAIGRKGLGSHQTNLDSLLQVPNYVWLGLSTSLERVFGLPGSGALLLLGLGTWLFLRTDLRRTAAAPAVAMALGALLLYLVVGVGRSAFGVEQARASRYVYICMALLLPAIGLLLSEAAGTLPARHVVILGVLGLVFVHNLAALREAARAESLTETGIKRQLLAAVELESSGAQLLSMTPDPVYSPDITVPLLMRMKRDGKLPARTGVGSFDRLVAATYLQVAVTEAPLLGGAATGPPFIAATARTMTMPQKDRYCYTFAATGSNARVAVAVMAPASIQLRSAVAGELGVALSDAGEDSRQGPSRTFMLPTMGSRWLTLSHAPAILHLTLPEGELEICAVAKPV